MNLPATGWPTILTVMVLVLGWLNIVSATAEAEVRHGWKSGQATHLDGGSC